jgi:hypothetical protein
MDKITINELKGYLGTGLKIKFKIIGRYSSTKQDVLQGRHVDNLSIYQFFKPLLYPLSSLTEYREDLGFVPMEALCSVEVQEEEDFKLYGTIPEYWKYLLSTKIRNWDNWQVEKLYEWHFDVHNLIDRNLAINIKTLKNG